MLVKHPSSPKDSCQVRGLSREHRFLELAHQIDNHLPLGFLSTLKGFHVAWCSSSVDSYPAPYAIWKTDVFISSQTPKSDSLEIMTYAAYDLS